jgi:hypothetical protein
MHIKETVARDNKSPQKNPTQNSIITVKLIPTPPQNSRNKFLFFDKK